MALVFGAAGVVVYSTASPAPSFPTGGTSQRKYAYLLFVGTKPDSTPADVPSGFTFLGAFSGGAGTTGIDTGPTRIGVFYQESASILSGTVTVSVPGNNVSWAVIYRLECGLTENFDFAITGGADTAGGTAFSVVTASVAAGFLQTGDLLLVANTFPTDTIPTWGTPTLTAQGGGTISLGTVTQRSLPASSSGQDIGGRIASCSPTVTNQQAGTLTFAATLSGTTTNAHGPAALLRARVVVPLSPPTSRTISASVLTSTSVRLSWSDDTGASPDPTYLIEKSTDGTNWTTHASGVTAQTQYDVTGLTPYTPYWFRVTGSNASGSSTSNTVTATPVPWTRSNNFESGTNGTAISTGNSGSTGNDAFNLNYQATYPPEYSNAVAHSGSLAFRQFTDTAEHCMVGWNFRSTPKVHLYVRAYLYLSGALETHTAIVFNNSIGNPVALIDLLATRRLRITSTGPSSSIVLPTSGWSRVELDYYSGGATPGITIRLFVGANVDGTVPDDEFYHEMSLSTAGDVLFGTFNGALGGIAGLQYWDDVALGDEGWIGPSQAAGYPKVATLTDDFATEDSAKWDAYGEPSINVVGGELVMDATGSYAEMASLGTFDLSDSAIKMQVLERPVPTDGTTESFVRFDVDANNYVSFRLVDNTLHMVERVAGAAVQDDTVAFDDATMKGLRIRHAVDTLYWETTANGTSWTVRASRVTAGDYSVGNVKLMAASTGDSSPGRLRLDNFNVDWEVAAYSGNLATSGSGGLSFGGNLIAIPSQALATSGGGTLSLSGVARPAGALATSGGGTLGLTGAPRPAGALATSGGGVLSLTGVPAVARPAAFSGGGTLGLSGTPQLIDTPPLGVSGGGSLSLSGTPRLIDTPPLGVSGGGVLSLSGAKVEAYAGALTLSGGGVLALSGVARYSAALATSGGGVLSLTGVPAVARPLTLSGGGVLSLAGVPSVARPLALSGGGTLGLSGAPGGVGSLALSGGGVLALAAVPSVARPLTLSGGGSLALSGAPSWAGSLALSGGGVLTLAGAPSWVGSLALSGGGSLALAGGVTVLAALATSGSGSLALTGAPRPAGALATGGSGVLTLGAVRAGAGGTLATAGSGSLALSGGLVTVIAGLTLAGSGALTLAGAPRPTGMLATAGGGLLTLAGVARPTGALATGGSGVLTLAGVARPTGALATAGSGVLTLNAVRAGAVGLLATSGGGLLNLSAQGAGVGTLVVSGGGLLTLTGGAPAVARPLALAGSGLLTLAAVPRLARTMALSGSGILTLAAVPRLARPLALAGSGALTLAAAASAAGGLNHTGSGLLTLSAAAARMVAALATGGGGSIAFAVPSSYAGALTTSGTGSVSLAGEPAAAGALTTSGGGSLTLAGEPGIIRSLATSGGGALIFPSVGPRVVVTGSLSLTGDGSLELAESYVGGSGILEFTGGGGLEVAGQGTLVAGFDLSGGGVLTLFGRGKVGPRYPGVRHPAGRITTPTAQGTVRPAGSGGILAPNGGGGRLARAGGSGTIRRAP